MGFFSDFAIAFNEVSDCTFNTLIVRAHAQSNHVAQEYKKMLSDPNFKNTAETKAILMSSTKDARKSFGISIDAKPEAQPAPKKPARKRTQPQQASN